MALELDPERTLALAYVPAVRRPAIEALWRLDVTLASVLATGTEPMISRIRLAWWRESLEKLDSAPPPAEPVLEAIARYVLPTGITGAELAPMEEGWASLVTSGPMTPDDLDAYARCRGGLLFACSARLLGHPHEPAGQAGELWALVDFARHSTSIEERAAALAAARARSDTRRWPVPLRPIGMLAVLANRDVARGADLERLGSPARICRMLRHRFTGR